ncbi:pyridoxamine 5'-phosphate oxidase family protein [Streptococcus sp. UBA4344]|nr:pyridoxamine 5'-phosphate oxidase family protein [Streptococcus sp. UBA4344]
MLKKENGGLIMPEMRRRDREVRDLAEIKAIIEKNMILHLGLFDEEFPYVVPLHYGYEFKEENHQFIFYMHGAKQGHKIDLIHQNPNVCIQIEGEVIPDYDHEIPCKYGAFFTSFIGRGKAEFLEDSEQKAYALNQLMQHQTGKMFEFTEKMTNSVAVIKVVIDYYTAKAKKMKSAK